MSDRIADYLYQLSGDSSFYAEECGDVETIGWHCLFDGTLIDPSNEIMEEAARDCELTAEEREELTRAVGAIFMQDNYGNKYATLYDNADVMIQDWEIILADDETAEEDDDAS